MDAIVTQMIILFILVIVGYYLSKKKMMDADFDRKPSATPTAKTVHPASWATAFSHIASGCSQEIRKRFRSISIPNTKPTSSWKS